MMGIFARVAGTVLLFFALPSLSHAQTVPFQMRLNISLTLDQSRAMTFDRSWSVIARRLMQDGFPFYTVVSESGNDRLILVIIGSYGDIATVAEYVDRYSSLEDSALQDAAHSLRTSITAHRSYVTRIARDLTYSPADSYRSGYVRYSHYSFDINDKERATALFRKYCKMLEKAKIASALHARWLSVGSEGVTLELLRAADSHAELEAFEAEIRTKLDPLELMSFEQELRTLAKSATHRDWIPRPELSVSTRPK